MPVENVYLPNYTKFDETNYATVKEAMKACIASQCGGITSVQMPDGTKKWQVRQSRILERSLCQETSLVYLPVFSFCFFLKCLHFGDAKSCMC